MSVKTRSCPFVSIAAGEGFADYSRDLTVGHFKTWVQEFAPSRW
jgi:hypothetical protein